MQYAIRNRPFDICPFSQNKNLRYTYQSSPASRGSPTQSPIKSSHSNIKMILLGKKKGIYQSEINLKSISNF